MVNKLQDWIELHNDGNKILTKNEQHKIWNGKGLGVNPSQETVLVPSRMNPKDRRRMGVGNFASLKRMFTPIFIPPSSSPLLVIKPSFKETFRNPLLLWKDQTRKKMNNKKILWSNYNKKYYFVQQMCKFGVNKTTQNVAENSSQHFFPGVNFTNIIRAAFAPIFLRQKSTNLKSMYKKVSRETFVRKSRA